MVLNIFVYLGHGFDNLRRQRDPPVKSLMKKMVHFHRGMCPAPPQHKKQVSLPNDSSNKEAVLVEIDLDELSEARRVVVPDRARVSERLQDRVALQNLHKKVHNTRQITTKNRGREEGTVVSYRGKRNSG